MYSYTWQKSKHIDNIVRVDSMRATMALILPFVHVGTNYGSRELLNFLYKYWKTEKHIFGKGEQTKSTVTAYFSSFFSLTLKLPEQ